MIPTINTFERQIRQAIKTHGKESILSYIKSNDFFNIAADTTVWFFTDWVHVEITNSLYVLYLYPSGQYIIDYIGSQEHRREEEGFVSDDSIFSVLLSLI